MGTYCGSVVLDIRMKKPNRDFQEQNISKENYENISTEKSCEICFWVSVIAVILSVIATAINNLIAFIIGLAAGEFFLFLSISPFAIGIMACVSSNLRGQANAVSLFIAYAVGGFPAPATIGGIFEVADLRWGMLVAVGWLFWCAVFWWLSWRMSKNHGGTLRYKWLFWKTNSYDEPPTASVNAVLFVDEIVISDKNSRELSFKDT